MLKNIDYNFFQSERSFHKNNFANPSFERSPPLLTNKCKKANERISILPPVVAVKSFDNEKK